MKRCPACMSNSTVYLDSLKVKQDFSNNILPNSYKIVRCKICNLFFKDHIPNDKEINLYYNSLGGDKWNYQVVYPYEKYLKGILKNLPDKSNVLDVGCNTGRLLKEETTRLNCYGIEINKEAAGIAEIAGIKIIAEQVEEGTLVENSYDLITLIDVFEHLNDPLPFVRLLIKALKPKGKLYIFTGRTDCLPAYLCGSYYWYYRLAQHLIFLNGRFIKWFEKNNSDVKVSIIPMSHFFSNIRVRIYQISWLVAWRFFSPNSPYKIFSIGRLKKLKEPFMVTCWKDHVFFIVEKRDL